MNQRELNPFAYKSLPKSVREIKDMDTKSGIVTGYLSSFDTIDAALDMVVKGAFKRTIAERGPNGTNQIKHLLQHCSDDPIGAFQILKEDNFGLYFESKISAIDDAQDVLTLYAEGIYNEHSIGYRTIKEERVEDNNGNLLYYKLTEIKLWEGSTVLWGCNPETPFTGFKSTEKPAQIIELNERMTNVIKLTHSGNFKDSTYEKLEIELLKLKAAYNALITQEPPRSTPAPNSELKQLMEINELL